MFLLIPLAFITGLIVGLAAVLAAILGRPNITAMLARLCIVGSLGSSFLFFLWLGRDLFLHAYAFFASPCLLGFVAIAICRYQVRTKPLQANQFSIAIVLYVMTVVAFFLQLFKIIHSELSHW